MKRLLILVTIIALNGCTDPALETVQKQFIDDHRTITLKQALNNISFCSSPIWTSQSESEYRSIVKYSCTFSDSEDFNEQFRETYKKFLNDKTNFAISSNEKIIESLKSQSEEYKSNLIKSEKEITLLEDIENLKKPDIFTSNYRDSNESNDIALLNKIKEKILNLIKEPNSQELNLLFKNIKVIDLTTSMLEADRKSANAIYEARDYLRHNAGLWPGNAEMQKQEKEVEKVHLKQLQDNLPVVLKYTNLEIKRLQEKINESILQEKLTYKDNLISAVKYNKKSIKDNENRIVNFSNIVEGHQNYLKDIENIANKKFPIYESLQANFYWTVNSEHEAFLTDAELIAISQDPQQNKDFFTKKTEERKEHLLRSMLSKNTKSHLSILDRYGR